MKDDAETQPTQPKGGKKRHRHGPDRPGGPSHGRTKGAPPSTWSSKTMHHPAFRIGEIKHGKT